MNHCEQLSDFTSSYAGTFTNPDIYLDGWQYNNYATEESAKTCGGDILVNVNNKNLDERNTCKTDTSYPSNLDVKKISDAGSNTKGMDEGFIVYKPQPIMREPFKSKNKKGIFEDHTFLLIVFAFLLYLVYTLISLKMEVAYLHKIIQFNMHYMSRLPPTI